MSDTVWKRVQYLNTQATAGSVSAMASGMLTLACTNLQDGLAIAGWNIIASANSSSNYSLTGDVWTDWTQISPTTGWCVMQAPDTLVKYVGSNGASGGQKLYMLFYPSNNYYLNVIFSLSPFAFSGGSLPTWGVDAWGYSSTVASTDPMYSADGYTAIPTTGLDFTNETLVTTEGGFIFTHKANSAAGVYTDSNVPRIMLACLPILSPRKGDFCPVVTFKSVGTSTGGTALSSALSQNSLHVMDGTSNHKWRSLFWDGYSWKQTKVGLMGLGYSVNSSGNSTSSAVITGPNSYPASSSNKIFAYKSMMLSCSPGARFYKGTLPDVYVTPSTYTSTVDTDTGVVSQFGLNNLNVLANTANHVVLSPEIKLFNLIAPPKPSYIKVDAQDIDLTKIDTSAVTRAQRQLEEAQQILSVAKTVGIDTTSKDVAVAQQVVVTVPGPAPVAYGQSSNIDPAVNYEIPVIGTVSVTTSGTAAGDDTGAQYYALGGLNIKPQAKVYICLSTGDANTAVRMRPSTPNIIELPGELGLDSDVGNPAWLNFEAYWQERVVAPTNPSLAEDFSIKIQTTPSFYISVENVSTKTTPIDLALVVNRYNESQKTNFVE